MYGNLPLEIHSKQCFHFLKTDQHLGSTQVYVFQDIEKTLFGKIRCGMSREILGGVDASFQNATDDAHGGTLVGGQSEAGKVATGHVVKKCGPNCKFIASVGSAWLSAGAVTEGKNMQSCFICRGLVHR